MQALLRAAGRRAAAAAGQVRRMSSGVSHEEEVKQMNLWRNVTIAGAGIPALQWNSLLVFCSISLTLLTVQLADSWHPQWTRQRQRPTRYRACWTQATKQR